MCQEGKQLQRLQLLISTASPVRNSPQVRSEQNAWAGVHCFAASVLSFTADCGVEFNLRRTRGDVEPRVMSPAFMDVDMVEECDALHFANADLAAVAAMDENLDLELDHVGVVEPPIAALVCAPALSADPVAGPEGPDSEHELWFASAIGIPGMMHVLRNA